MTTNQTIFRSRGGRRTSTSSIARSPGWRSLCQVSILDPGVVERVLHNDASVCGTANPAAFAKLRDLLIMHFLIRKRSAEAVGQVADRGDRARRHRRLKSLRDLSKADVA